MYIVMDMRDYTIFSKTGGTLNKGEAVVIQKRLNASKEYPPRTFRVFKLIECKLCGGLPGDGTG